MKRKISLMCDVDEEAVVDRGRRAVDLRHPEGAARARASTPTSYAGSTCRSATSTGRAWDDLLRRVHHPNEEVTVALVGKYVDLPDAYLSVAEALRAGGFAHDAQGQHRAGSPPTTARPPRAPPGSSADVDAVCVPGGFGVRGIEGKLGALTLRPRARHPDARAVPGPAVHGDRVRPQRGRPREGRLDRVRPRLPGAGDRHDGRAARRRRGRGRPGRHDAARPLPGRRSPRARWSARRTAPTGSRSGTGTATRSTTPTASQLEEAGLVFSGHCRRTATWSSSSSCPRDVHPYYVATQAHPELRSRPDPPAPAVRGPGRRGDRPAARAAVPDRRVRRCAAALDADDEVTRTAWTCRRAASSWPVAAVDGRLHRGDWVLGAARRHRRARPGDPDDDVRPAGASSTPARWWSSPSTTRSGCWCCASTGTRSRHAARRAAGRAARRRPGEDPVVAAQRELREEAALAAAELDGTWSTTYCRRRASATRRIALYLARGPARAADRDGFEPQHEEADMTRRLGAARRPPRRGARRAGSPTRPLAPRCSPTPLRHRLSRRPRPTSPGRVADRARGHRLRGPAQRRDGAPVRRSCDVKVGVPKEVKNHEYRVAITPDRGARAGRARARGVRREGRRASARSIPDEEYVAAGRQDPRHAPTTSGATPRWCSRSRSRSPRSTTGCARARCSSPTCTWPPTGR